MIYRGHEKENHRGSHVRYFHCGKWHEGTLLEPVNYQIVVTKEYPPAVLSCTEGGGVSAEKEREAAYRIALGRESNEDYDIIHQYSIEKNAPLCPEVESVTITDANDITQEEADALIEEYMKKYLGKE